MFQMFLSKYLKYHWVQNIGHYMDKKNLKHLLEISSNQESQV